MSETLRYLAYGSNLSTPRLRERVPSARALGAIELPSWELRFHKRSVDGSGKCGLARRESAGMPARGVVWEIAAAEKESLDAIEGVGAGYRVVTLRLGSAGRRRTVFTYLAEPTHVDEGLAPYHWYLELVVAGAVEHGLPASYVQRLRRTPTRRDPNRRRAERNRRLVAGTSRPAEDVAAAPPFRPGGDPW